MSRVTLSEFRAKKLVFEVLGLKYTGIYIDLGSKSYIKDIDKLSSNRLYVAKVDQAVKRRNKSGLVTIGRTKRQAINDLKGFAKKGYRSALIEPYIKHPKDDERYIALTRTENGVNLSHSKKGGIDVELNRSMVHHEPLDESGNRTTKSPGPDSKLTSLLYDLFQKCHMTLLEINPLVVHKGAPMPLDAAVEVDSAGQFFAGGAWDESDVRQSKLRPAKAEEVVGELNVNSPSSLSLKVLNPNGAFFLLLSGGGASVVMADELAYLGNASDIGNYGEYSGNPSEDETYAYAHEVIRLMLDSKSPTKVLIIAGGVANFTDVAKTFAGIIRALRGNAELMKKQKIRVLVRRGGPNQAKGLSAMSSFLQEIDISHEVYGPEVSLAQTAARAVRKVR